MKRGVSRIFLAFAVSFGASAGTACGESSSGDGEPSGSGSGGASASGGSTTGGSTTGGSTTGGSATGGSATGGSGSGGAGGSATVAGSGGSAMGGAGGAAVLGACTIDDPESCPSGYECACGGPGPGQCLCHKSCTRDADCGTAGMTCGCDTVPSMPAYCVDACFCQCD